MQIPEIIAADAHALAKALAAGTLTAADLCEALLTQVDATADSVSAFASVDKQRIRDAAKASDARRLAGKPLGPLDGVPVVIKDNIAIEGESLTCASRMLANFVSPYTGTAAQRLLAAGMIPFGRANMDEFAMGSSTENSALRLTRNPWAPDRAPGGSSGGSAAAVAARCAPLALGSDTGGSIRQPAAFCGVIGLKPTYGSVSRFGLVAFASSLDQIGPIGRTTRDVAALYDVLRGHDPLDSTSWPEALPACSPVIEDGKALRIGLPDEYFAEGMDPEVRAAIETAVATLKAAGHSVQPVRLPHTSLAVATYYIIATAEASSNLGRFDGVRYGHRSELASDAIDLFSKSRGEGFGPEVKRRIILGSYVLSSGYYDAYYKRAQQVRTLIRDDFLKAFGDVDVILTPTTPTPAFKLGEKLDDPLSMYLADIYTIPVNLAGLPALSMPCGLSKDSLPLAFQLIGKPFAEDALLQLARGFEKAAPFTSRPPCASNFKS